MKTNIEGEGETYLVGTALHYTVPTIMLLMGMKMSFTKKPMKPITINPSPVLKATFENSVQQKKNQCIKSLNDPIFVFYTMTYVLTIIKALHN
jgi:hypothetical protein